MGRFWESGYDENLHLSWTESWAATWESAEENEEDIQYNKHLCVMEKY